VLALTLLFGSEVPPRRITGRDEVDGGSPGVALSDAATVQSVVRESAGIEQASCGRGRATGVHVSLSTAAETVMVHLAPHGSWKAKCS
jgi:hypothetical protein